MDYTTTFVQVNLPNSDLGQIQAGQKVNVTNYALEGETFEGWVTAIEPTIDAQTRTFTATVQVENERLRLRPGMFVKTDIIIEDHPDAVIIPDAAAPPEAVVRAELEEQDVEGLSQDPVKASQAAGAGLARHTRVDRPERLARRVGHGLEY